MKKILPIMVILTMLLTAVPAVLADDCDDCPVDPVNEAEYLGGVSDIETIAHVAGSSGGSGGSGGDGGDGNSPPIIKAKWEYDLDVCIAQQDCDPFPCDCDVWMHDACPWTPGLQVRPILGCSVKVGYFAIVTDPEGVGTVSAVYADVWHPDGSFKYQIELLPICPEDTLGAIDIWEHAIDCHLDLITFNGYDEYEIWDELHQGDAYIYYGEAYISYCQPGGMYYVGVRGHDSFGAWCDYVFNCFLYIPTAAIEVDFNTLDYGTCVISSNKWIGGDDMMYDPDNKATVRNIGNTPVGLFVWQDDMQFGQTGEDWNVIFDARLGAPSDNPHVEYLPYETCCLMPGVRIPGVLELCTKEKLDFSIHVFKGFPTEPSSGEPLEYSGSMRLFAAIEGGPLFLTPMPFIQNAPLGVPDIYPGP
jgi:hypothetical protein